MLYEERRLARFPKSAEGAAIIPIANAETAMVDTQSGRPIRRLEVHAEDGRRLVPGDTRLADFRTQENS